LFYKSLLFLIYGENLKMTKLLIWREYLLVMTNLNHNCLVITNMLTPSAARTRLHVAAADTNIASAVAVRTSYGVSNPSLLFKDAGSSSASKAVVIQVIAETGDKAASAPKKRIRIEKDAQAEEANMEQEAEAMKVDKSNEEINGAVVFGDSLYTNPLFDAKIVKAGTGKVTRPASINEYNRLELSRYR
jgi:hypothetical protein